MHDLAQQLGARFEPCAELRRLAAATVGQPQMHGMQG
jgi:hypothetical protein